MVLTDEKKNDAAHADVPDSANASVEGADCTSIAFERRVAKIRRKVDLRLCLIIAVLYTVCQIDRKNLAYAYVPTVSSRRALVMLTDPCSVVAGMGKDIDLSGIHYVSHSLLSFSELYIQYSFCILFTASIHPRLPTSLYTVLDIFFRFCNELLPRASGSLRSRNAS